MCTAGAAFPPRAGVMDRATSGIRAAAAAAAYMHGRERKERKRGWGNMADVGRERENPRQHEKKLTKGVRIVRTLAAR